MLKLSRFKLARRVGSVAVCMATISIAPSNLHSQIASTLTLGALLSQLNGVLDSAIGRASNEGDYLLFRAATESRIMIESMRQASSDVIGKTFSQLDSSQQQLFLNIKKNVDNISSITKETSEHATKIVEELHQISASWQFSGPILLRSYPTVVYVKNDGSTPLILRGIYLDEADPRVIINNTELDRTDLTLQEARFDLKYDILQKTENKTTLNKGQVILRVKKCVVFNIACQYEERHIVFSVMALPEVVATLRISRQKSMEKRIYETQLYERHFSSGTGDLINRTCETFSVSPRQKQWIDIDSIAVKTEKRSCGPRPNEHSGLGKIFAQAYDKQCPDGLRTVTLDSGEGRSSWQFKSKTEGGYAVEICTKAVINGLHKKNGLRNVTLNWREYKLDTVRESVPMEEMKLKWGQPIAKPYPADTFSILVTAKRFDGIENTFSGNGNFKFGEISWDAGTKQLIISAKKPDQIADLAE